MKRQRGELERTVLEALWDHGGWLTPGEVGSELQLDLAYTTVVTVLRRLYDKGIIDRQPDGRAHVYRPHRNREEHTAVAMAELLAGAQDSATALNYFVATLGDDNRRQLSRLLRPK